MAEAIKWTVDVRPSQVAASAFQLGHGPVDDQIFYTQQWYRLTPMQAAAVPRQAPAENSDAVAKKEESGAEEKAEGKARVKTEAGKWKVSSAARREQMNRILAVGRHYEVIWEALEFYRDNCADLDDEKSEKVLRACDACQAATEADWKKMVEKRLRQREKTGRELRDDEKWMEDFLQPDPTTWALESMPGYPGLREEATRFTPPEQVMRGVKKE